MDERRIGLGGRAVLDRLTRAMDTGSGVHPGSLLCAVGAVTGAACFRDARDIYVKGRGLPEEQVFDVRHARNGDRYFFGDLLDELLVSDRYSPVSVAGGACAKLGARLPDVADILRYTAYTAGSESFGKVRSCDSGESALSYGRKLSPGLLPAAAGFCETGELRAVMGAALQAAVLSCGSFMSPTEAARVPIEAAVICARAGIG